ncbi:glycine zipper 2TM domain-containing protein [Brasilonema sp. CT11]|nr:glycine zipper 2TM domain-containing protein [Brasilonema sp. CT11]
MQHNTSEATDSHIAARGIGAVGGGAAGAALGRSIIGGKMGAAIGGIAGAIAGGLAGNKLAELTEEATEELNPNVELKLGANNKPVELPRHYTWEELQALSKPQV